MRPLRSTIVTSPTCRIVALHGIQIPSILSLPLFMSHWSGATPAERSVCADNRRELMRQKVAAQRRFASRHPGILEPLDIPEVLVRIDPHGFMINGSGAAETSANSVSREASDPAIREALKHN